MSINDWAATGRKEYEEVPDVAATAQWQTFIRLGIVYTQSHDLIHGRGTTKLAALPNAHSMLRDRNGIMIQRERELRPTRTTHGDVVESCGAYEQMSYICHLELMPLHLF